MLDRYLRHDDKPVIAFAREVDEEKSAAREPPHQGVCGGNRSHLPEHTEDLALVVLQRRRSLLERHRKARLGSLLREARAVRLTVGAVDLDFEIAAALVLDLDSLEAESGRAPLQRVRGGKRREMPEDRLVVGPHFRLDAGGNRGSRAPSRDCDSCREKQYKSG